MTGYYDVVLGVVPLAMIVVPGVLWAGGLSPTLAVVAGSGVALAVICHALFVNGPTGGPPVDAPLPGHDADQEPNPDANPEADLAPADD